MIHALHYLCAHFADGGTEVYAAGETFCTRVAKETSSRAHVGLRRARLMGLCWETQGDLGGDIEEHVPQAGDLVWLSRPSPEWPQLAFPGLSSYLLDICSITSAPSTDIPCPVVTLPHVPASVHLPIQSPTPGVASPWRHCLSTTFPEDLAERRCLCWLHSCHTTACPCPVLPGCSVRGGHCPLPPTLPPSSLG